MKGKIRFAVAVMALVILVGCPGTDTTNPTVTIVYPANNALLDTGRVTIKAVANDNKKVARVEFYDGAAKIGEDGTPTADTFDVSWTATAGAHTLKAVAVDEAENTAEHSINVTVTAGGGAGPTYHSEDIVGGDSIWYPGGNPHIVSGRINIYQNGKLIIKPGCVVKFEPDAALVIGHDSPGELQAVGTADSMIYFTSNAATPNPGDWRGLDFYPDARTGSRLSYCEINYACWPNYAAVNIEGDQSIKIDHTTIKNSSKWGIWIGGDNGYVDGFTGNTITSCGSYPIYTPANKLHLWQGGNTLTGNAKDGIYVAGGDVSETGTWQNQGVPYIIGDNVTVGSDAGAYLTVAPGTVVQFTTDRHIAIGHTKPGGFKADSVTFTSAATTPQRGDWHGLWFYDRATDAECRLTSCRVEYGGGDGYGNIWIEDAVPTITGCYIAHSAGWGIYLEGSEYPDPDELEANNTFEDNASGNVRRP